MEDVRRGRVPAFFRRLVRTIDRHDPIGKLNARQRVVAGPIARELKGQTLVAMLRLARVTRDRATGHALPAPVR
jgi:hypothetical protein